MGFHGRVAAHKTKITMRNAKHWLEGCKARRYWTLKQCKCVVWTDESLFIIWQSHGKILCLVNARQTLPAPMHSANCKVWWRNNGVGLFFMVRARLHSSSEEKS
jgi:hypothetical protein